MATDPSPMNSATPADGTSSTDDWSDTVRNAVDSRGQRAEPGTARHLSELARTLYAASDRFELMLAITHAAALEVDGADFAGISLVEHRTVTCAAATDPLVERIDQLQYHSGQGPCLSSLREQLTVRSDDLADEQRWPDFSAGAAGLGVRSMLSVQLFVDDDNLGALNLYSRTPAAFDHDDESSAILLASHAASP